MRPLKILFMAVLVLLPGLAGMAEESSPTLDAFRAARQAYDESRMADVRAALMGRANAQPEDYDAQIDAAECLRITGSELRTRRQAQRVGGKEAKELKAQQENWSAEGIVFAERALGLATTNARMAQTHRIYGELYANSITGMLAGLKNGPKARTHMDAAMAQTPEDPECQRAMGIMYLNNPPFNGGDVNRAIETFSHCHELVPESDTYMVLLSMAYQKNKDWPKAMEAADEALQLNGANPNAVALKEAITAKAEVIE
jgi:tetratricopeptide (TPR) repeat protein